MCGTQEDEYDAVDNPLITAEVVDRELASLDEVDWKNIYDGDDKQKFEKRTLANATEARDAMPENTKRSLVPKQEIFMASSGRSNLMRSKLYLCSWMAPCIDCIIYILSLLKAAIYCDLMRRHT